MKGQIVELIKIANTMRAIGSENKPTALMISDGDELVKYYTSIFKKNCSSYNIIKSTGGIVSNMGMKPIIGIADEEPIVDKIFTINNHSWNTSKVLIIIEDCIIVTMNSIYAIHNKSNFRERKLKEIGI